MSQRLWSSLRRLLATGIDAQVLKTGIAAGTSWYLAQWLFRTPRPYFAPLAAILSLQVSVADSISKGIQRVAGVGAGIAVAIFAGHFFRLSALSVGIVVYIAVFLATRLHMGPQGIPQAAITALLVMTVGRSASGYAWVRVVDTAIGVMVAVLVNALIWPPDATKAAETAIITLAHAVADVLLSIRQDLIDGLSAAEANQHLLRARHVDESLETVRDAIRRAEKSLKWNVLMVRRRRRLKTLRQVAIVLEHTLSQVRGIARSLFVTVERDTQDPYLALPESIATQLADLLALMGSALQTYIRIIVGVHPDAAYQLEKTLKQASKRQRLLLQEIRVSAGDWLDLAAVLADIEKMTEDLLVSARLLVPLVFPST
ncbi:MAG: FUSC family protein [Sulfobacillus thermosulfidooxidans]|uniref:FUSC family protein n=1 Tax=Sulfobacillus thermosulfidooxidans TaxID=28034 RepID=A0A2T2X4T5_SULTH|nr:MAG: FUSC family protein [Sulfobacillus thermosulfidooxidans]